MHVASTRNPNQIYAFRPLAGTLARKDRPQPETDERPLMPVAARFLPGCLYLHDLALDRRRAARQRRRTERGRPPRRRRRHEPVWWPRCIERRGVPDFERNYLQLNSIAAGPTLEDSFFSASGDAIGERRPGQRNFPVDRRGVIFSGATREPVVRGLTRPHSARLAPESCGSTTAATARSASTADGTFEPVARLPGWTRGLGFAGGFAFVGTSRVIPRFSAVRAGARRDEAVCGVLRRRDAHRQGASASIVWPIGNQIFAVELDRRATPRPAFRSATGRTTRRGWSGCSTAIAHPHGGAGRR